MNKKRLWMGRKRKEKERLRREEQERIRQKIFLHAEELAEEMNLRLMLDLQSDAELRNAGGEMWVWVDSVNIIGLEFLPKRKKSVFNPLRTLRTFWNKRNKEKTKRKR